MFYKLYFGRFCWNFWIIYLTVLSKTFYFAAQKKRELSLNFQKKGTHQGNYGKYFETMQNAI